MSEFQTLIGRGFEKTGWFVHRSEDNTFFAAIDFKILQNAAVSEIIHWENVLRQYLNFYAEELFKTMKGKMDLAEVSKVVLTAWEMRNRSVFVFKTTDHPRNLLSLQRLRFIAGVGHVRANSKHEKMPSEADNIEMPRTKDVGVEIGRLCLCPEIHVAEKKSVIHNLLKLYLPILSREISFESLSLRTSKRHRRYYQDVFSEFIDRGKESFLSGDRDVILQIDPESLRPYGLLDPTESERPLRPHAPSISPGAA